MSIEERFDIALIGALALKEKQIQQNYRPIIAVHKWFARRPGTLFRGLILSEFGTRPLAESFFSANDFPGRLIADPFVGGGTPTARSDTGTQEANPGAVVDCQPDPEGTGGR